MIIASLLKILLQALLIFLLSTIAFDLCHWVLHQLMQSRRHWLKRIGDMHAVHHRFYSVLLKINESLAQKNILRHLLMEYSVQCLVILFCVAVFPLSPVLLALFLNTVIFICVCYCRGQDPHHQPYEYLPSHRGGFFVRAEYHALHHVYPKNFFSSYVKLMDWLFGTGLQLAGKKIVMTGASGALGRHMKVRLEKAGASIIACKYGEDYTYDNYEKMREPLANADILFLCHGSKFENAKQANCDSFIAIIELFKAVRPRGLIPLEVWGVGSEIECHPCFGMKKLQVYAQSKRQFAHAARQYYRSRDIQYRHLVHSAFISRMGSGLMTANFAAAVTVFLLRRGFKYVPVTYTGFAWLNYLRFVFNK